MTHLKLEVNSCAWDKWEGIVRPAALPCNDFNALNDLTDFPAKGRPACGGNDVNDLNDLNGFNWERSWKGVLVKYPYMQVRY